MPCYWLPLSCFNLPLTERGRRKRRGLSPSREAGVSWLEPAVLPLARWSNIEQNLDHGTDSRVPPRCTPRPAHSLSLIYHFSTTSSGAHAAARRRTPPHAAARRHKPV